MEIKVLGTGCQKCKVLETQVRDLISELNLEANVTKIEDIMEIMKYGVAATPALIIDEKVVIKGRIPSRDEIISYLTK